MFFALLGKGINSELPCWPEVVVVFDGQDCSAQRKEADAGYKANRPADSEALKPIRALPSVKAGLGLFAIIWDEIRCRGRRRNRYLAASCPERDVLIASVDQDYYQLLRDARPGHGSVQVLNTARRAGSRLAGPAEVRARHCQDRSRSPGRRPHPGRPARLRAADRQEGRRDHQRWQQVLTWRDMIRMNNQVPVPARAISGLATTPLPRPAEVIEKLGLWRRVPPAEQNGTPW
jgi:DNA polymerase-1